jgi:hypothetical protein
VPSLAVLPAVGGVLAVAACVRAAGEGRERGGAVVRIADEVGLGGGAAAPAG